VVTLIKLLKRGHVALTGGNCQRQVGIWRRFRLCCRHQGTVQYWEDLTICHTSPLSKPGAMKRVRKSPFLTNLQKSFEGFSTKAGLGYGNGVMAGLREKLSKELQTNYKKDVRSKNTEEQLTVQEQPRLPCSCVLLL